MGGAQSTSGLEKTTHHRRSDRIRGIGHDVEGLARQPEIGGVGANDRGPASEASLEMCGALRVQFDGDHAHASVDQRRREGTEPGTDVEHERAVGQPGVTDEPVRDSRVESVPSPPWPRPGHADAPS
jgi:hypothetical protein